MSRFACLVSFLALLLPAPGFAAADAARTRLEDLFVWKAADELRLPIEQEQKFSEAVRAANVRKKAASERLERATKRLSAEAAAPEKALAEYRAALVEYSRAPETEFDQLVKILGREQLARYLTLKSEMNEKLKDLLSRPAEKPADPVKAEAPRAPSPAKAAPVAAPAPAPAPIAAPPETAVPDARTRGN